MTAAAYGEVLGAEIDWAVALQERAGIDVLVHGEPERDDMVRYFSRPAPMTVEWARYTRSRTDKPV